MHFFVRVFAAGETAESTSSLAIMFDEAMVLLSKLPQMFCEPDGSFVWRGQEGTQRWQVEGNLIDGGETLFYAEIKGSCPHAELDQLLACLSTGISALAFEWVEQGLVMNEAKFRECIQKRKS